MRTIRPGQRQFPAPRPGGGARLRRHGRQSVLPTQPRRPVKVRALDYPANEETPIGDPIVSFIRLDDDWAGTAPSWDTNKWVTTATNSTRLVDVLNNEGRLQVISSSARASANMAPVGDSDVTFTYQFESNTVRSYLRPMLRARDGSGSNQMQTAIG